MSDPNKWMPLFENFISNIRIDSKEVASLDDRGAPFEMWASQETFLYELASGLDAGQREFLCLKSRQLGISTISLALVDVFWMAVHPGLTGALVTDTPKNANACRAVITRMVRSFPKGYLGKFKIVRSHSGGIQYSNGSRLDILVAGTGKKSISWGEGVGYVVAHAMELGAYGNPAGYESFKESLSVEHPDRLVVEESTAKGMNFFRDMWIDAGKDSATKRRFFIGWWAKPQNQIPKHDERFKKFGAAKIDSEERERINLVKERHGVTITIEQVAWRRWKDSKEGADEGTLQQNQPWIEEDAWVLTGFSFFMTRVVQRDLEYAYDPANEPEFTFKAYRYYIGNDFFAVQTEKIDDYDRIDEVELRVWHEPVDGASYVIGADPAYGRNDWKDKGAISVWRCYADRLVQCAEYASDAIDTRQFAWILAHLAGAYKDCMVNLELTGPGRAVMVEFDGLRDRLRAEMFQKQVEQRKFDDFLSNARWYMQTRPDSAGPGFMWNSDMNFKTKWQMMNQLRDHYHMSLLAIKSALLLEEMLIVTQEGNDIGAPGRGHDDRVFAAGHANSTWLQWIRPRMIAEGMTYEAVDAVERGDVHPMTAVANRIVERFFKRQEELAEMEPESPAWMIQRGLA
jgi:hypothetical protein